MKKIIYSALAIGGMFAFISCERHTWEDSSEGAKDGTKRLYPKTEHAQHADDHSGEAHSKKEEHAKPAH